MDRRQFLSLCGLGMTGVAGCIGMGGDRQPTTEGDTTSPEPELRIEFSGLQAGVVGLVEDAYEIASKPDSQYLFLDVHVDSGTIPSITDFQFHFAGDMYSPKTEWNHPPLHRGEGSGRGYPDTTGKERYWDDGSTDGWIAFQVPETGDASGAVLSWPSGEWSPAETIRSRLANPIPEFTVEEWAVPETVSPDTDPKFELTVRNEGSHPGHFWGAIDGDGATTDRLVTLVSRRIPPGESRSWAVRGRTYQMGSAANSVEQVTYTLRWLGEDRSASARVRYE
ncbi:hypothetical protein [Halodesulfurarchaeum formicicum]|uniref:Uncharacterized protein n=1 Tax=Halodesulfurarchaeum formicicum TaxID=1873524 RepID=A0A1J1AC03_9EURY|nr:hypothetical protein [Halodesulfurarchaeum formicicum]APE95113.1 hypothetical protein HSR6_0653 [Halodesulfurarchaeum formicicum]